MAKNKKVNKEPVVIDSATDEVKKLVTILTIVIGIVCIFYIITVFVTKNNGNLKYSKNDSVSEISYDTILASDITRKNGDYYVLVYKNSDQYLTLFKSYISKYVALDNHSDVYYVDILDALNQKYYGENNSFDVNNLVFNDTTLLHMNDGNILDIYDNDEAIESYLKSLITNS